MMPDTGGQHDQAIDARPAGKGQHILDRAFFFQRRGMADDLIAAPCRFSSDATLHGVEDQGVAIIMDDADQEGSTLGQRPCAQAGPEIQGGNSLFDAFAGVVADARRIVENARNRPNRNAGAIRNVRNGRLMSVVERRIAIHGRTLCCLTASVTRYHHADLFDLTGEIERHNPRP